MSTLRTTLCVLVITPWLTLSAQAEVPRLLHYESYLTNTDGEAIHCPDEVACVIELPVPHLVESFHRRRFRRGDREVVSFAVEFDGVLVWGVTGWILRTLLRHVAPERDYEALPVAGVHEQACSMYSVLYGGPRGLSQANIFELRC